MKVTSRTPSSSKDSPSKKQLDTERRARTERVDYKALHSGRLSLFPEERTPQSKSKKEPEIVKKPSTIDSSSPPMPSASSSAAAARTSLSAQRSALREQKLRADPLVEVHGPVDVTCRRCGTHIKLSTKSTYDPFHWQRHIERCTKRPISSIRKGKESAGASKASGHKKARSSLSKAAQALPTGRSSPSTRTRSKKGSNDTPALTPDKGSPSQPRRGQGVNSISSILVKEESPDVQVLSPPARVLSPALPPTPSPDPDADVEPDSSPLPSTPSATPLPLLPEPDIVLEDYCRRTRRRPTRAFSPLTSESWRSWSWSQLKEPVWVIRSYPGPGPAAGGGYGEHGLGSAVGESCFEVDMGGGGMNETDEGMRGTPGEARRAHSPGAPPQQFQWRFDKH